MNHYPFHVGDYAAHTRYLSPMADLAYRRMLDLYYMSEKPLPAEPAEVARLIGLSDYIKDVSDVLSDFFVKSEQGHRNQRADEEIAAYQAKADRARGAGKKRLNGEKFHDFSDSDVKSDVKSEQESENNQNQNQNHINTHTVTQETSTVGSRGLPDCPHEAIIGLYHELLPTSPRVMRWGKERKGYLRQRWLEQSRPSETSKGYDTQEAGLNWFRRYFAFVAKSDFLTGRTKAREGREPFVASLEWLLLPSNFTNVLEGKYHGGMKQ